MPTWYYQKKLRFHREVAESSDAVPESKIALANMHTESEWYNIKHLLKELEVKKDLLRLIILLTSTGGCAVKYLVTESRGVSCFHWNRRLQFQRHHVYQVWTSSLTTLARFFFFVVDTNEGLTVNTFIQTTLIFMKEWVDHFLTKIKNFLQCRLENIHRPQNIVFQILRWYLRIE